MEGSDSGHRSKRLSLLADSRKKAFVAGSLPMTLILLTALTMFAFAANSVIARVALADATIDAASYTALRLTFGAAVLGLLTFRRAVKNEVVALERGTWSSALALFVYAAGFSFAYLALDTGMGALILFACVQATMISWSVWSGDRPSTRQWIGLVVAFGAFIALVSPGLSAPDPLGAALMAAAGVGWGIYSLRGRSSRRPLLTNAGNFAKATVFGLLLVAAVFMLTDLELTISTRGILLAFLSGAGTSGLGYALWYRCLEQLTATTAAIVQLSVPAIAALGGVVFSAEVLTTRLALCSVLILGGVAYATVNRHSTSSPRRAKPQQDEA